MKLGQVLDDYAFANHLSVRDLAAEIGIPSATAHRLRHGENVDSVTLAKVLTWLLSEQKVTDERRRKPNPKP
jgi:DNA-binding Xre family transcriptional regulator